MKGKIALGLLLLLSQLTFSATGNLLGDPSMEAFGYWKLAQPDYMYRTDLTPGYWWESSDYVFQTNYTAHSGVRSRLIYKYYYNDGWNLGFTQIVNLTKYKTYDYMNVTIYTKNDSVIGPTGNFTMYVRFLNSARNQISNHSVTFVPPASWAKRGFTYMVIPAGTKYAQVIIAAPGLWGKYAFFDDASMVMFD